jgi:hypothetical protein
LTDPIGLNALAPMNFRRALLAGIAGALGGYLLAAGGGAALAPVLGISSFEGEAGYFAAFLCGPLGAIVGLIAGVVLVLRRRGIRAVGAVTGHVALVTVSIAALVAAGIGIMYMNRDLVSSNGAPPQLAFEIRLPPGAIAPPPNDITVHLDSAKGHLPGILFVDKFRRDGDRPVIVGVVDIPYRESRRLLVLRLPNQPDRLFVLGLGRDPGHAKELGPWHHVDYIAEAGHEPLRASDHDDYDVRYRPAWVGED